MLLSHRRDIRKSALLLPFSPHLDLKARNVLISICAAELLAMTVWFSVTAIAPSLKSEFGLSENQVANMVMMVQLGFVAGTLAIALANLADVFNTRHLFAFSCSLAALTNLAFLWNADNLTVAFILRFLTGFALAGVYPPGMKILAGWFQRGRGFAIGAMIGAITLGSSLPHLIGGLVRGQWQLTILISSGLALLAGLIMLVGVQEGPYDQPARKFNFKYVFTIMKYRPTRLAYFGYFGHMWELYAMWTWIPVFLAQALSRNDAVPFDSRLSVFFIIGAGAIGCLFYGLWADRIGRCRSTIAAMAVSGICCFVVGHLGNSSAWLLLVVCIIWGITIVADSAQFSAAVTELSEPEYIGTALTLQTSIGFLITMASIRVLPLIQDSFGWASSFSVLGLGPIAGIVAMYLLYLSPESLKMASGRR